MKKAAQFLFGIGLFSFGIYGWHQLEIEGVISFFLCSVGLFACMNALDMELT